MLLMLDMKAYSLLAILLAIFLLTSCTASKYETMTEVPDTAAHAQGSGVRDASQVNSGRPVDAAGMPMGRP